MESCSSLSTTPLWVLLLIYERAEYVCYINYMHGFKALTAWLSPIEIPTYTSIKAPQMFCSYTMQQIAHHLSMDQDMIYTCMIKEVIPRLELIDKEYRSYD